MKKPGLNYKGLAGGINYWVKNNKFKSLFNDVLTTTSVKHISLIKEEESAFDIGGVPFPILSIPLNNYGRLLVIRTDGKMYYTGPEVEEEKELLSVMAGVPVFRERILEALDNLHKAEAKIILGYYSSSKGAEVQTPLLSYYGSDGLGYPGMLALEAHAAIVTTLKKLRAKLKYYVDVCDNNRTLTERKISQETRVAEIITKIIKGSHLQRPHGGRADVMPASVLSLRVPSYSSSARRSQSSEYLVAQEYMNSISSISLKSYNALFCLDLAKNKYFEACVLKGTTAKEPTLGRYWYRDVFRKTGGYVYSNRLTTRYVLLKTARTAKGELIGLICARELKQYKNGYNVVKSLNTGSFCVLAVRLSEVKEPEKLERILPEDYSIVDAEYWEGIPEEKRSHLALEYDMESMGVSALAVKSLCKQGKLYRIVKKEPFRPHTNYAKTLGVKIYAGLMNDVGG